MPLPDHAPHDVNQRRQDEDRQQCGDGERHQDHESRVDQRRLGLADHALSGCVFDGEQPQGLGDRPPHLADAHHAEEVMLEGGGLAAHRVGHTLPAPHGELEPPDHRPERRPLVLPPQALHRPIQVDPGVEIAGELPAEVHEVLAGDAAEAPLVPPRLPDGAGGSVEARRGTVGSAWWGSTSYVGSVAGRSSMLIRESPRPPDWIGRRVPRRRAPRPLRRESRCNAIGQLDEPDLRRLDPSSCNYESYPHRTPWAMRLHDD